MDSELTGRLEGIKAKKIAIQIPEGLKTKALEIVREFEEKGFETVIFSEPCYGACDLLDHEAKLLGCDALVQYGHSEFKIKTEIPVFFVEYPSDVPALTIAEQALPYLEWYKKIGLVTTVQHIRELEKIKEKIGGKAAIGKHGPRTKYDGQIQGCDFNSATSIDADAYLYIGSGNFHPLGVALATGKPVIIADTTLGKIRVLAKEREKFLRQRFVAIESCRDARTFGILISTKPGQYRSVLVKKIESLLKKHGKESMKIAARNTKPEDLLGIGADAYINTTCPRIALDDYPRFKKPVLSCPELEILLGEKKWENYQLDTMS